MRSVLLSTLVAVTTVGNQKEPGRRGARLVKTRPGRGLVYWSPRRTHHRHCRSPTGVVAVAPVTTACPAKAFCDRRDRSVASKARFSPKTTPVARLFRNGTPIARFARGFPSATQLGVGPCSSLLRPFFSRCASDTGWQPYWRWHAHSSSCAPGFSWTLDCERVLAGGVSRWGNQIRNRRRRRGPGGGGRFSVGRKRDVVLRLLRGEDLESVSRELGITAARASQWRDRFLAAGQASLKSRAPDARDEVNRQRQRWLATALLDIEPRLRKVMGYRHLPKLRDALKRELKIDTTTSKKKAA